MYPVLLVIRVREEELVILDQSTCCGKIMVAKLMFMVGKIFAL